MTSPPPSVPQQDASPIVNHSDAESASGEVGSDADEESERVGESAVSRGRHTRQSSYSRPPSRPHSRAATSRDRSRPRSVVKSSISASADGHRSVSRQSTVRNRPFDDFVVRRRDSMAESEALFDPRPVREGSIRSSTSGYGKGGWAAAAASRSGASSPVMYMPTTGNEGWAHFQAPPRESRFTPLPPASQPMTFDRLLNSGYQGGLAPPVTHNGHREPTGSSPSEYSQSSDEDELLPKPSRSYAKKDYGSDRSRSPSASQDQSQDSTPSAELRQSQEYVGTLSNPSPIDPCAEARRSTTPSLADNHWPRTDVLLPSRPPSVIPRPPRSPSRPMSPGSMHSRPMSPIMPDDMASRPSSRIGFDTPSFLNPDTLTLLPEMSLEDSARTYRPTQSETGRSRQSGRPDAMPKRSHSMFGGFARSLNSEGDHDEDDEMPELTPRRAKSAQGRRNGGLSAKWEGSSYGEGQLMESNGRVSESTGGYT